jgi:acyl-coenzyme A thioesterase PaaI-like protein
MTQANNIQNAFSSATLKLWLQKTPYAMFLGMKAELHKTDFLFTLPKDERFIGNPSLPALHGGVVGAFMEQAAALQLIVSMKEPRLPKIINFSLDYLRPARLHDTYAKCVLNRQGRFITNITVTAWQEQLDQPNAIARAHFLTPQPT